METIRTGVLIVPQCVAVNVQLVASSKSGKSNKCSSAVFTARSTESVTFWGIVRNVYTNRGRCHVMLCLCFISFCHDSVSSEKKNM